MTQNNRFQRGDYNNQMGLACAYTSAYPTATDNAFQATQDANQDLAQSVVVQVYTPTGALDGNRSNALTQQVQNIYVYLTAAVIAAAGVTAVLSPTTRDSLRRMLLFQGFLTNRTVFLPHLHTRLFYCEWALNKVKLARATRARPIKFQASFGERGRGD